MPYVKDDDGRLNNFAKEPPVYAAEPMDATQKRNRTLVFALGGALVVGLIAVAAVIS
ncbi:ssl1498 family light-harvesting-like protein [filamentous cyanobacterium LEGE 11480]|uniref:Ssl1498 family light-harvesting-like protein n=1 Tax=Romeriopsis navalis LEGE 11480 TaxID=2777977 RepID=A0A928Z4E4_9CYAN|nr:ssl1498 family light-harvesting-like protein [Romeriopsis navalis]MBE9031684.1 ssl1498 family light-harvesting-like protein [Romeriopsis navalis LEGE 11480]